MNLFKNLFTKPQSTSGVTFSSLYNEVTFYKQFAKDLLAAKQEVIIESPFITTKRLNMLMSIFEKLVSKNVQVFIITKDPKEHDDLMAEHAEVGICYFEEIGCQVLLIQGGHHRKLAMIDRKLLWEGSLNILSQSHSREFMRRLESKKLTDELFQFLQFSKLDLFKKNIV